MEEGGYYTDDDDGIEVEVPYGAMPGETIDVRLPDGSVVHAMVLARSRAG